MISCLDIAANGSVVKGVRFEGLREAGDPAVLAKRYDEMGADEIVFLDITASSDDRDTLLDVVRRTADEVFIPLTVGGGVRSVEDARALLRAGADKVSVNTAAIARPALITELATEFGSQCVVVAIDGRQGPNGYGVWSHGGRQDARLEVTTWAAVVERLGAGEILLTSMDTDGTKEGFDIGMTRAVTGRVGIPVIASGGVGHAGHLVEGALEGGADAVLAASIFHFGEVTIAEAKEALTAAGVTVRPV